MFSNLLIYLTLHVLGNITSIWETVAEIKLSSREKKVPSTYQKVGNGVQLHLLLKFTAFANRFVYWNCRIRNDPINSYGHCTKYLP